MAQKLSKLEPFLIHRIWGFWPIFGALGGNFKKRLDEAKYIANINFHGQTNEILDAPVGLGEFSGINPCLPIVS